MSTYYANDKYNAVLTAGYSVGQTTLYVSAVPNHVPTIIVAAKGTENETVFAVTDKTTNSLTGVSRLRGANVNLDAQTPLTCLNNEEFINQLASVNAVFNEEHDETGKHTTDQINEKTEDAGVTVDGLLIKDSGPTGWDGWMIANETWTYASADDPTFTITVPSGAASKYSEGMRIKLTQTTDKYFIITKVADTVLTVYGGTDYDLVDAAITSPYYSTQKAPLGFPLDPTKWTIETKNTGNCSQSSPTSGTWYNLGSINIAIPIGVWRVYYQTIIMPQKANTTDLGMYVTLSTANNSQSDHDFTSLFSIYETATGGANFRTFSLVNREKFLNLASKTTYYLNAKTNISGMTTIAFRGDQASTIIRAVCAYL